MMPQMGWWIARVTATAVREQERAISFEVIEAISDRGTRMEIISTISNIGILVVALVGVCIAILQLRSASRDAHQSRIADMAWQIYQAYADAKIRDARGVAETIAHTAPVLASGQEYGEKYADKQIYVTEPPEASYDTMMRRLLRFYNQIGILLEKKLADDDMVFALIGPGLKSAWPAISAAVDWYQNHSSFRLQDSASDKANPIYTHVMGLNEYYSKWEQSVVARTKGKISRTSRLAHRRK
jgi:hypothetical protein